ncbi:uncharacterized protein LOC127845785 [Dreissena polymorpha]|uniref:FG-GAP repeat-containing protein n=1 Tax=Dreissena polymorpha TaxID=45954 RepID=A0A9D4IG17_DREPO|nr:uncharacterized protein LOC127845785 [Dreissena polymorpha]XP_052232888.1 uncharacterized protein LOC127845785 [Dreissena polymorpha]XP_052232889.1 uncharacterized protein LOC127845785 [Dreissena polymorpha]XP_052232890.1 uncharacterized protein LOC127845785 [Dreissena polymorpha]XP_052232891.1 uncharacterized protein LOC127845785 [Dreissena polymorpha]KAH3774066.1 hypothetical protein DPMN_175437 [Dreissena polymorpha]
MGIISKIRTPSKNHFILLLLCAVISYLIRSRDSYELRPVWRKRAEYHHFENKKYPVKSEQLPPPVITDLDSDGINEVILVTNDLKLSVMTLPDAVKKDEEDKTLPHVSVKHKAVLPQATNGGQDQPSGWPVVMVTGFTEPYLSMVQVRHQVIVIVTNTWWVFCYSSDLKLLWQRQLLDFKEQFDNYYVKSMGAHVTSQSVKKSDGGLIIVGGSYAHKQHLETEEKEINKDGNATDSSHKEHSVDENTYTHFSTFALAGRDGTTRWHHLPGEFGEEETKHEEQGQEQHWKLSLKRHRLHVGESPWTYYKNELYKALPHNWRDVKDTRFTLGRYQKVVDEGMYQEGEEKSGAQSPTPAALDPKHVIGYAYGGQRPHSHSEHVTNANAVVINHQNGVEVLNLLTGRPITRLQLPDDGAVYGTLDAENDIKKLSWGEQERYSPCFLEIQRLFPIKEQLERFPVCMTKRLFFTTNWVYDEDMFVKLPPLVIKSVARKSGIIRHLLGHHLRNETDAYDLIAIGSLGRVSSVDKNGDFNWQTQTSASWDGVALVVRQMKKSDWTEQSHEFLNSFHPDRVLMPLQLYGDKVNLILVGWSSVSLIELTEGRVLAEHSTPCPSTGPLVVGDFNNDGYNDVIFTCKFGYIGFSLHRRANHTYTVMYGVSVFLVILVIGWILSPERRYHRTGDSDDDDST